MITELYKILAICLLAGAFCLILRKQSGEYAFAITVAAGIVVFLAVFKAFIEPLGELTQKLSDYGVELTYFKVALKAVGVAYITDFIADTCRDSGQTSLAAKAELAGKAAIFLLSVPLLISVLETAVGFVK